MTKRVMLALLTTLSVATACSSGGGNVTSPNSLNPTTAPSGVVATASPTAAGATPTATPTAAASASAPAATPSPTPTSTTSAVAATPSPTPAASASASGSNLATTCATSAASPSSMVYTLPGNAETIQLPNYPATPPYQITGSSDVPSQSPANTKLTIQISQNSISGGSFITPSGKTDDFYTTLEENTSTQFGGSNNTSLLIPVTITSPCVVSGRTYTIDEASSGLSIYTETDTATMSGSVTGHIQVSLNPFPANTLVSITVSH